MQEQEEEEIIVAKSKPTDARREQDRGKVQACLDKFFDCSESGCVEKPYSKHLQGNLPRGQEEIQNPTQRRVLKEG